MIGVRQRTGHMIVIEHPTNLCVRSVNVHKFVVLLPANYMAIIKPCECWSTNNISYTVRYDLGGTTQLVRNLPCMQIFIIWAQASWQLIIHV